MYKLSCFYFGNPTNKTGTGTAYMWGLLIANHLDWSLWSTNQKHWTAVRFNSLHSFFGGARLCCAFYQPRQAAHFDFLTINFTVWSHILSTIGDALINPTFGGPHLNFTINCSSRNIHSDWSATSSRDMKPKFQGGRSMVPFWWYHIW
jgi:hypothetical protein